MPIETQPTRVVINTYPEQQCLSTNILQKESSIHLFGNNVSQHRVYMMTYQCISKKTMSPHTQRIRLIINTSPRKKFLSLQTL